MHSNVLAYLEDYATRLFPDSTFVSSNATRLSFAQVKRSAEELASLLCRLVFDQRRPIAVLLPRGPEVIIADIAILMTGTCYSNLDTASPAARLKTIVSILHPAVIIVSRETLGLARLICPAEIKVVVVEDILAENPTVDLMAIAKRKHSSREIDPVCIINTSGSTGTPKCVVMSHRNVISFIEWVTGAFPFGQETFGSLSPFHFDIYTLELFVALKTGSCISIIPDGLAAFPRRIIEHLQRESVSFIFWVPSIMVVIANQDLLRDVNLDKLRQVFFAGEVFPTKHFNYWRRHSHAVFVNLYGPIEITVDCTFFVVDRDIADTEPIPIGSECGNAEILILDDSGRPVGAGQTGEIYVRGPGVALGYWNSPEKTALAFMQNPLHDEYRDIVYKTGDLAYRNGNNEIVFVGRKDFQIKHHGYRIELGEIEHAAMSVAGIHEACVTYNSNERLIVLHYTSDVDLSDRYLRENLLKIVPKYMLPSVFRRLESMPLNANGKIDRLSLASS